MNEKEKPAGDNAADNLPRHVLEAKDLPWLNNAKEELTLPEVTDPVLKALSWSGRHQEAKKKRRKDWINPLLSDDHHRSPTL